MIFILQYFPFHVVYIYIYSQNITVISVNFLFNLLSWWCGNATHSNNFFFILQICEMKNCNKCILFEGRMKRDLYMWIANVPDGPSAKFLVENGMYLFFFLLYKYDI